MQSKIRDPKQLASLTLWNSVFPMELHAERELVPAFVATHDEHFKA